jgi:hypothetical protein
MRKLDMREWMAAVFVAGLVGFTLAARAAAAGSAAEEPHGTHATQPAAGHARGHDAESESGSGDTPHPTISEDGHWAGALTVGILFMFVAAAAVGTAVHAHAPEELPPPAHSHDEPPGASHHHGPGGTVAEEPHH